MGGLLRTIAVESLMRMSIGMQGGKMNPVQFDSKLANLTSLARKILGCVPKNDAWTLSEINSELVRQNISTDSKKTRGVLKSLEEAGLIREMVRGKWQQLKVKTREQVTAITREPAQPVISENAAAACPIDSLSDIADRVRVFAIDMETLAGAIETVALDVEEQLHEKGERNKKLEAMRTLMADVFGGGS
ncbi:MAG: hypothetical protein OQK12_16845 [Motiliproteus sp.]|nr:hypothetical protein [Motiliproteus sp.]MCW9051258.1 hypothetical protein [Motiliproteus sp.]